MQASLSNDLSHIHYFLEEVYLKENIRGTDWKKAYIILKRILKSGSERYLAWFSG